MDRLLRESLLCRLWLGFLQLCRSSGTAALLRRLLGSPPFRALRRASEEPSPTARSRFGKLLSGLGRALCSMGRRIRPVWEQSAIGRILRRADVLTRESLFLGPLLQRGWTGLLLGVLGLFGVIDWLLRDVLSVPVLSSGWDEGLLLFALLLVLFKALFVPRKPVPAPSRMSLPLLQFFLVSAALFFLTLGTRPDISLSGLRATCQGILWLPILLYLLRGKEDFRRLCGLLVGTAFFLSLHGIYQYIVAAPIPSSWVEATELGVRTRVYSIFGSPNILGDYLVLFTPMTLALVYTAKERWQKLVFLGMTLCMLTACLFTLSRGAWIGMFLAALVFALLTDLRLLLLLGVGTLLSLALPFVSRRLLFLFTPEYAASAAQGGRLIRREKALSYLKTYANPLLGLGYGRFGGAIAMQNRIDPRMEYFYTDNYYLKLLAENGITGLVSFLILQLGLLWSGFCSWRRVRGSGKTPLAAGMLAGLSGVLVHCLFENIFEEPYMLVYFWCVAALLVFLGRETERGL